MTKYKKEEQGYLGVLAGSASDLSKIDFSPWGFNCLHINSPELKEWVLEHSIEELGETTWEHIYSWSRRELYSETDSPFWDCDNLYVLIPISLKNLPTDEAIAECRLALLVVFPSEIRILHIHHLQVFDERWIHTSSTSSWDPPLYIERGYYLLYDEERLNNINAFLKLYSERIDTLNYVRTALKFYSAAWSNNDMLMSFMSLCICLEGIVPGKEQLTYRFRRNLAVLCGENEYAATFIYENAKLLYDLRSRIVHSDLEAKNYKVIPVYYKYAQTIASRMLIEMILHEVSTIKELDERLTTLGFGSRHEISDNYSNFEGNVLTEGGIWVQKLPKL